MFQGQLQSSVSWGHLFDAEVDTPAVVVDWQRCAANIERAQNYCDQYGLRFRPHVKTHKMPLIAEMQIAAGAVGVTCQTLGEAEVMARAGIGDILITYPVLGGRKPARLADLATRVRVSVAADSPEAVEACALAAARAGRQIGFLVECDTGMGRLGVQTPEQATWLAGRATATDGVRFDGLMTYPTAPGSAAFLMSCLALLDRTGLSANVVSGGGTPTLYGTHEMAGGVINEVRAGEYVFGDRTHLHAGVVGADQLAAVVISTVVGRPTANRVVLDAGSKALSSDPAGIEGLTGFGVVAEYPDAVIYELSEEHAHVDISDCSRAPCIGDRVAVIPNHICPCINLAGQVALRRADGVELVTVAAQR
jgi:D-serine deaminase-like pyridoxal phosphate-dependent protein